MRAALLGAALLGGCAMTRAPRPDARLAVECPVAEARIFVDDRFYGLATQVRGLALPVVAGVRRVEVRAEGWFPAYRDVLVTKGGVTRVAVPLREVPAIESEAGE